MGSDSGSPTAVQAPESPFTSQQPGGAADSATTSVPGSPTDDTAVAARLSDAGDARGGDAGTQPAEAVDNERPAGDGAAAGAALDDDDLSDLGSVYRGSDGGGSVRADKPDGAEPDAQQQLKQALARITQLEDQNVALWQVRRATGSKKKRF